MQVWERCAGDERGVLAGEAALECRTRPTEPQRAEARGLARDGCMGMRDEGFGAFGQAAWQVP